jgi:hypothetical protein
MSSLTWVGTMSCVAVGKRKGRNALVTVRDGVQIPAQDMPAESTRNKKRSTHF